MTMLQRAAKVKTRTKKVREYRAAYMHYLGRPITG